LPLFERERIVAPPRETLMKILGNIVGVVLLLIGALWTLQGSNVLAGSAMSGQSQWLYIGIVLIIVGLIALYWTNMRARTPRM
jgi:protein-S-isoprenylcysteine O-methyltransferase Ste14